MSDPGDQAAKKAAREAKKKAAAARKAEAAKKKAEAKKNATASQSQPKKKAEPKKSEIRLKTEFVNTTPKGEKKDMTREMAKAYDPPAVEAAWYDWWEEQGFFKPPETAPEDEKPYVIIIPPPNVTGQLHVGHALMASIEDVITRWRRMTGQTVLWVPATDHAGIATQDVVEKTLLRDEGKSRHDYGREKFVEKVWEWKESKGGKIIQQLRRMGASVDWSREFFSLDKTRNVAVNEAFVRLFEDGLIYRANRLVNWCSKLNTAIANIEVDKIDLETPKKMKVPGHKGEYDFGWIWSFAYKFCDSDDEIVVATTRPETMLGDTGVAVHPDDDRYKKFHGKFVQHPFCDRKIPIVLDRELVRINEGTGAVKITPAHDPNDFACGERHDLPRINVFTDLGEMNEEGHQFKGMMRYDARDAVLKALEEKGLYRGRKEHKMVLGLCSRSKDVIEPMLKPQWWLNCSDMAKKAADAVRNGELKIMPKSYEATWFGWLDNIEDWCISRQLWWGHRIPAWLVAIEGGELPDPFDNKSYVAAPSEESAKEKAARKFNVDISKVSVSQDEDVLDTWFSSGLFPFSAFGWPEKTVDLERFFPTSLLETGHDIIFFWVARMVMMSLTLMGRLPFTEVFFHAMVRDAQGRKMSKHRGNVVDPIWVIEGRTLKQLHSYLEGGNLSKDEVEVSQQGQTENFPNGISECGTDAMRMALCADTAEGRSINLNVNQVVSLRNFCNKLWNVVKFAMANFDDNFKPNTASAATTASTIQEQWILSRLNNCIVQTIDGLHTYRFSQSVDALRSFWLNEFSAVFLEAMKPLVYNSDAESKASACSVLYECLDIGFRLLHPFMPFLTEELWQRLPRREGETSPTIMKAKYPHPIDAWNKQEVEADMRVCLEAVTESRKLKTQYGMLKKGGTLYLKCDGESSQRAGERMYRISACIETLSGLGEVKVIPSSEMPQGCGIHVLNDSITIMLSLKGEVDVAKELAKLQKKADAAERAISGLEKKFSNPNFAKASEDVQAKDKEKYEAKKAELAQIRESMEWFKALE